MQAVNVLCIKWGNKYGPEYVNKLHSMVRRHLHRPFRFVCLTDDGAGIDPSIEVKPIPMIGFDEFDQRKPWTFGHGWLKLTSFAPQLYDLQGTTFTLTPLDGGHTRLQLRAEFRLSTSINGYALPVARWLGSDFIRTILGLYKGRSERAATRTSDLSRRTGS